jgi:hypothetical protein
MKTNKLKENMKRFNTKNLNEQPYGESNENKQIKRKYETV